MLLVDFVACLPFRLVLYLYIAYFWVGMIVTFLVWVCLNWFVVWALVVVF